MYGVSFAALVDDVEHGLAAHYSFAAELHELGVRDLQVVVALQHQLVQFLRRGLASSGLGLLAEPAQCYQQLGIHF